MAMAGRVIVSALSSTHFDINFIIFITLPYVVRLCECNEWVLVSHVYISWTHARYVWSVSMSLDIPIKLYLYPLRIHCALHTYIYEYKI